MLFHARLGLPLLCVALGFAAGCKSVPQPPQVQSAGMRIDVVKLSHSKSKQRIDVRVKLWNDHEQRIEFELGNVRLLFNSREISAKALKGDDPSPDVQARSNRDFNWYFEVGEMIGEGLYPIEIRDMHKGGLPLGDTAQFAIKVGA